MASVGQKRPASVTLVSALTWIAAALDIIAGAGLVWLSYNTDEIETVIPEGELLWYGIMTLVVGALTAAVAAGLAMGVQAARVWVMIIMAVRLALAVWALAEVKGFTVSQAAFEILVAIVVLVLLSTRSASAWFRGATS